MTMRYSKLRQQDKSTKCVLVTEFSAILTQKKIEIWTMKSLPNRPKTWWCHEIYAVVQIKDLVSRLAPPILLIPIKKKKRLKCLLHLPLVECEVNLFLGWLSSLQNQSVKGKSRIADSDLVLTKETKVKMKLKSKTLNYNQEATPAQQMTLILKITSKY